jgi:hypothetical protein
VPISVDALFCGSCDGYFHPFLDACPSCGTARDARYDAAVAEPNLGFGALLAEPRVIDRVRETVLRYSLKALSGPVGGEVREGFGVVAGALPYVVRSGGAVQAESRAAFLHLAADDLVVEERNPRREVLRLPLAMIVATRAAAKGRPVAGAWAGVTAFGRHDAAPQPAVDGSLVVAVAGPAGVGRVGIGNRRGIFVAQARADHYTIVARWLGILAAAAAEAHWEAVGPARHAAELGLAAPGMPPPVPAAGDDLRATPAPAGSGGPGGSTMGGTGSVADALATLEDLRVRGLVTDAEYAAKRSEILARL